MLRISGNPCRSRDTAQMQRCYINSQNFFFRSVSLEHQGVQSFHERYSKNNLRSMQTRTKLAPNKQTKKIQL